MTILIERTETTRILTDRWGELLDLDPVATQEQIAAVSALLPAMWDELTFVAEFCGQSGILFESEYDDGLQPTENDADRLAALAAQFPLASFWFTQGGHIFCERYAIRAFVPRHHAAPEMSEAIGHSILNLHHSGETLKIV